MHVVSESNVCPSTSSIRNVSNICRSVPYATCIWAGGSGRPEGQVASISLGQPRAASGILKIRAAPFFKRLRVDRWIHRGRLELSSQLDVSSHLWNDLNNRNIIVSVDPTSVSLLHLSEHSTRQTPCLIYLSDARSHSLLTIRRQCMSCVQHVQYR